MRTISYDPSQYLSNLSDVYKLVELEKRVAGLFCVIKNSQGEVCGVGCAFGKRKIITSSQVVGYLDDDCIGMKAQFVVGTKKVELNIIDGAVLGCPWACVPEGNSLGYTIAEVDKSKQSKKVFTRSRVHLSRNQIEDCRIIAVTKADGSPSFIRRKEYPHGNPLPKGAVQIGIDSNNNLEVCALYVGVGENHNKWLTARTISSHFARNLSTSEWHGVVSGLETHPGYLSYVSGKRCFSEGKYQEAEPLLELAAGRHFLSAQYWLLLCRMKPQERDDQRQKDRNQAALDLQADNTITNVDTLTNLGLWHLYGIRVLVSPRKAIEYFKRAVQMQDSSGKANHFLAECYSAGWGCEVDAAKAFQHWKVAADKDYVGACAPLAKCYLDGFGTDPSPLKAFACYLKGAQGGSKAAIEEVARCYEQGIGVSSDDEMAKKWRNAL